MCVCVCVSRVKSKSYLLAVPGGNSSSTTGKHDWLAWFVFHLVFVLIYQLLGEGCVKGAAVVLLALSATNTLKLAPEVEQMAASQGKKAGGPKKAKRLRFGLQLV